MKKKTASIELINRIFSKPTAPFRERFVSFEIQKILSENKIPFFLDSSGNLIAGSPSKRELNKTERLCFIAHMDHPGFLLQKRIRAKTWSAIYYGGIDPKLLKGAYKKPSFF